MQVENAGQLSPEELVQVQQQVGSHTTLQDVLAWGFQQPLEERCPQVIADFVEHDEFSQDVLVPWRKSWWLVYQST